METSLSNTSRWLTQPSPNSNTTFSTVYASSTGEPIKSYYDIRNGDSTYSKTAENVQWILSLVIIPCVSLPGILGNVSSLIVLYRHGFKKTSNILLAALTLADAFYLIGVNNVAYFIHEYSVNRGFCFSTSTSYFLYSLYRLYFLMELWGNWCSLTLPLLITLERLMAVYYPFRFPMIVTPFRTWMAVIIVYVFWVPINVYYFFLEDLIFEQQGDKTIGFIIKTHLYTDPYYKQIYIAVKMAAIILTEPVHVLLVIVGCTMVGVKVWTAHHKRQKMLSAVTSVVRHSTVIPAHRTTRTLMLVCMVYTVTIGSAFILQLNIDEKSGSTFDVVLQTMVRLVKCLHSSCNFFIYVYVNRNFRETYRGIFGSFVKRRNRPESDSSRDR